MNTKVILPLLILLLKNCCGTRPDAMSSGNDEHLDIFIIGGTGDLAKRYLWNGFFSLFRKHFLHLKNPTSVQFYGAGLTAFSKSSDNKTDPFQEIMESSLKCNEDKKCNLYKGLFISKARYIQLKNEAQYESLCFSINAKNFSRHEIIFYLSVPPFAYEGIVKNIATFCKLHIPKRIYKFVFEKPFGLDLLSAVTLSNMLEKYLQESQIYRVDHYLGKQTASQILNFRKNNSELDRLINRRYVKSVEVVVKETLGCEGRSSYYDKSGAIRDMLQSHLTEVLSLMLMDVNKKNGKLQFLKSISTVETSDILLGQYMGYSEEVFSETGKRNSQTSTFAAAKINVKSRRLKSVPVLILSGKKMDERVGYARILFKQKAATKYRNEGCQNAVQQVVYYIGHGALSTPAILVSHGLPVNQNYIPNGWHITSEFDDLILFGCKGKCFRIYVPQRDHVGAYTFLVSKLYEGKKEYFLPVDDLLESWRIWSPVVNKSERNTVLKLYNPDSSKVDALKFKVANDGLHFVNEPERCYIMNTFTKSCDTRPSVIPFMGHTAIIGHTEFVIEQLARSLRRAALSSKKDDFHLSLSGGNSPLALYRYLVQQMEDFPWQKTHIWQVDERCSLEHSNFALLKKYLLEKINRIDQGKVHPMPITSDTACSGNAGIIYEEELLQSLKGKTTTFDYVLLGMGADGHTASIFPDSDGACESARYVAVINVTSSTIKSPQRMTITFRTINESKNVAILVMGKSKCEMLKKLLELEDCTMKEYGSKCNSTVKKYPVCGVSPKSKRLQWFIDNDALSCFSSII